MTWTKCFAWVRIKSKSIEGREKKKKEEKGRNKTVKSHFTSSYPGDWHSSFFFSPSHFPLSWFFKTHLNFSHPDDSHGQLAENLGQLAILGFFPGMSNLLKSHYFPNTNSKQSSHPHEILCDPSGKVFCIFIQGDIWNHLIPLSIKHLELSMSVYISLTKINIHMHARLDLKVSFSPSWQLHACSFIRESFGKSSI